MIFPFKRRPPPIAPAPPPPAGPADALAPLKKGYPLGAEIFLPTREKFSADERARGLLRSRDCFERLYPLVYRPRLEKLRAWCADLRTCVILGNGPSLKDIDLASLRHVPTFGANGLYLAYPGTPFRATFHVVEDHLVAEDRAADLNQLGESIKLFPTYLAYCLEDDGAAIFYRHLPRPNAVQGNFEFSPDAADHTYAGCTVTFSSLQLAYYLGFRRILLVGLDHNYAIPADVQKRQDYNVSVLDMPSDDPNHFNRDYFGKGKRWHDPQVDKMDQAYVCARAFFQTHGVEIYNCTVGGKLEVFPRRPLGDCLAEIPAAENIEPLSLRQRLLADAPTPPPPQKLEILRLDLPETFPAEFALLQETRGTQNIGWHYPLDLVWLLAQVRRHLPVGSLILDAGAGSGLLQFLLLASGYNILSVDMAPRQFAKARLQSLAGRLFQIPVTAALSPQSATYLEHLRQTYGTPPPLNLPSATLADALALAFPSRLFVIQADLLDLSWLGEAQVDAVVSCSALEHNEAAAVQQIVSGLEAHTRPGGWHFHTVAAARDADFFHEPSKGWAYTAASAHRLYGLAENASDNYSDYDNIMADFRRTPNFLERNLAPFYFKSGANGMPWGRWDPQYLPLGVIKKIG
jgi:2-polyprenyl-3-methyl-5-hydroxy-6-metoxy-1,4-benzoquinol methylase